MAEVVRTFMGSYIKAHPNIPWSHVRAMEAILACRTAASGAHEVMCKACGVVEYAYHSCCHRACPRCSGMASRNWTERLKAEALPCKYFQVVFTTPAEFRELFQKHQAKAYDALLKASADTLAEIGKKRHKGTLGHLTILHTWTRDLHYHVHTHNLLPALAVRADGTVERIKFLASYTHLSRVFKAKLLKRLRAVVDVPRKLGSTHLKEWVVNVSVSDGEGGGHVVKYLGRYVHRTALSDSRILKVTETHVTFSYQDETRTKRKFMTLTGHAFLHRFLRHVLPKGFNRLRYYGFWGSANRSKRLHIRAQLLAGQPGDLNAPAPPGYELVLPEPKKAADFLLRCPHCGADARVLGARLTPAQAMDAAAELADDLTTQQKPPP